MARALTGLQLVMKSYLGSSRSRMYVGYRQRGIYSKMRRPPRISCGDLRTASCKGFRKKDVGEEVIRILHGDDPIPQENRVYIFSKGLHRFVNQFETGHRAVTSALRATLLLLLASLGAHQSAASQSLTGSYTGVISGTPSTLTLEHCGESLTGMIDADGFMFYLEGTYVEDGPAGSSGNGTLTDSPSGAAMSFEITERSGGLILAILSPDPIGQLQRVEVRFNRKQPATDAQAPPGTSSGSMQADSIDGGCPE